jgi:acetylcholinesterase
MDYLIHFATNLDPNGGSSPRWPQYTIASPQLMTFLPLRPTDITQNTYRADGIDYLTYLSLTHPLQEGVLGGNGWDSGIPSFSSPSRL